MGQPIEEFYSNLVICPFFDPACIHLWGQGGGWVPNPPCMQWSGWYGVGGQGLWYTANFTLGYLYQLRYTLSNVLWHGPFRITPSPRGCLLVTAQNTTMGKIYHRNAGTYYQYFIPKSWPNTVQFTAFPSLGSYPLLRDTVNVCNVSVMTVAGILAYDNAFHPIGENNEEQYGSETGRQTIKICSRLDKTNIYFAFENTTDTE